MRSFNVLEQLFANKPQLVTAIWLRTHKSTFNYGMVIAIYMTSPKGLIEKVSFTSSPGEQASLFEGYGRGVV